ncbi:MAG: V-type ATP synthase subunit A [Bacillota bacterium]|nr:V-type ATP synthase subunit A [Bacillota bacterium]
METKHSSGKILKIAGPLVVATGMRDVQMFDVVRVSEAGLIGEVIEVHGDQASIQVYEETAGLRPGEPVVSSGRPLSVELAPGLMGQIFDGIQRPLTAMYEQGGSQIQRGVEYDHLDRGRLWTFAPRVKPGDEVVAGDILGTVQETQVIEHRVMVPADLRGRYEVTAIAPGDYTILATVATLRPVGGGAAVDVRMLQTWPVRVARPHAGKHAPAEPLITGQRTIDMFNPITIGGTATIPGPFGSGKTVVQHQLAKWSAADIVVYIGCGERGNEMTDVLNEFPELIDPNTGRSMMERTILIANTSDMPVAAREASIYTGITIAEYYRDMGYSVSIMADSTSRWAEALREMSGRLEEMPGEEGYPAYLGSRLAQFYERAGAVTCLGQDRRPGYLTAIGAVSPPGGDMSDPVVQATLRIVKVFWRLDSDLAYRRHFPAINWMQSYSLYADKVTEWMDANIAGRWSARRRQALRLLADEAALEEIVRLVGADTLSAEDTIKLEAARSLREDFLHQNSFDPVDTYTPLAKQFYLLDLIMSYHDQAQEAARGGRPVRSLQNLDVMARIARYKAVDPDEAETVYREILQELEDEIARVG